MKNLKELWGQEGQIGVGVPYLGEGASGAGHPPLQGQLYQEDGAISTPVYSAGFEYGESWRSTERRHPEPEPKPKRGAPPLLLLVLLHLVSNIASLVAWRA